MGHPIRDLEAFSKQKCLYFRKIKREKNI